MPVNRAELTRRKTKSASDGGKLAPVALLRLAECLEAGGYCAQPGTALPGMRGIF